MTLPRDESGNMLPKPFWAGLEELFPLPPGWKATKRRDEQLKRFTTHFLISIVRDEHPKVVAAEEERKRLERKRLKRLIERKAEQYVSKGKRIKPLSEEEKRRLLSEEEQEEIRIEAGNRLKEMQRTGIPPLLFRAATICVRPMFDEYVAKVRAEARIDFLSAKEAH